MPDLWVVNASPLIILAKAGHLDLLTRTAGRVLVPGAVEAEIMAGPADDPARGALERGWGVRTARIAIPETVQEWSLGAGESSVIATALANSGATVVLDDAEARACAKAFGIPLVGTLGVVARARLHGHVSSARAVFQDLRRSGLYVDDRLVQRVLDELGET